MFLKKIKSKQKYKRPSAVLSFHTRYLFQINDYNEEPFSCLTFPFSVVSISLVAPVRLLMATRLRCCV